MIRRPDLQGVGQASVSPDEILHEPERRSPQGVIVPNPLDLRGFRHAGPADTVRLLDERDLGVFVLGQEEVGEGSALDAAAHYDATHNN